MKFFSKLLTVCGILALTAPAMAQAHKSRSFLNVASVTLTNIVNPTNLVTTGSARTNISGLIFTNNGARVVATNYAASRVNPFKDVALWSLTSGAPPISIVNSNGTVNNYFLSYGTLSVTHTNNSGANTAFSLVFTPIYNGVNEATAAAEQWTVGFTPTASSLQTQVTNVPLWRWPGAAKLRLRWAANTDTDANGDVIVTDISLNGYSP